MINWHQIEFETRRLMRALNPRGAFMVQAPDDRERWSRMSARSRIEFIRDPDPGPGTIGFEMKRVRMPRRPVK